MVEYNAAIDDSVPFSPYVKDGKPHHRPRDRQDQLGQPAAPRGRSTPSRSPAASPSPSAASGSTTELAVLDRAGRPLPGLFACGEIVGGLYYFNYPSGTGLTAGAVLAGSRVGRPPPEPGMTGTGWQDEAYATLRERGTTQFCYVPDSGHRRLIDLAHADEAVRAIPLTTEEEGVGIAAGAHLGLTRAVLLMQSSGVGNTINFLSLVQHCRIPFLTLVTMRGEFGEQNPWQFAMGRAVEATLHAMGVTTCADARGGVVLHRPRSAWSTRADRRWRCCSGSGCSAPRSSGRRYGGRNGTAGRAPAADRAAAAGRDRRAAR